MELNFLNYITSIGYQALIFMGENPHPLTQQKEKNLRQARLLLDTLILLREKTEGNLTDEESQFLNNTICEVQAKLKENSEPRGPHD
jgi:hypothetical protein